LGCRKARKVAHAGDVIEYAPADISSLQQANTI
jgi:hypothetical protein